MIVCFVDLINETLYTSIEATSQRAQSTHLSLDLVIIIDIRVSSGHLQKQTNVYNSVKSSEISL